MSRHVLSFHFIQSFSHSAILSASQSVINSLTHSFMHWSFHVIDFIYIHDMSLASQHHLLIYSWFDAPSNPDHSLLLHWHSQKGRRFLILGGASRLSSNDSITLGKKLTYQTTVVYSGGKGSVCEQVSGERELSQKQYTTSEVCWCNVGPVKQNNS